MREKLNNNPVYQAVFLGVLALGVALMLLMRMGGGSDESATTDATATPPTGSVTTVVGGTVPTTPGTAAAPTDPAATAAAPTDPSVTSTATTAPPPGSEATFKAGPGLPAPLVDAWDSGQAVALLVVNRKGVDDRDLERTVQSVGNHADVTVFTTDVKNIADYSRITEGVDVNRTPVLVVVQPKRLAEGPMPAATASYGFRGTGSVEQAFEDALYSGRDDLPYYP